MTTGLPELGLPLSTLAVLHGVGDSVSKLQQRKADLQIVLKAKFRSFG